MNCASQLMTLREAKMDKDWYHQDIAKLKAELGSDTVLKKLADVQLRVYNMILMVHEAIKLSQLRADETQQTRENRI